MDVADRTFCGDIVSHIEMDPDLISEFFEGGGNHTHDFFREQWI